MVISSECEMRLLKAVFGWFDERYICCRSSRRTSPASCARTLSWPLARGLSLLFPGPGVHRMLLLMYYKPDPNVAWERVTFIRSTSPWAAGATHPRVGAN